MTDIPVFFLDRNGRPTDDYVYGHPCVTIGFFFDDQLLAQPTKTFQYDPVIALIDTGADHVYVDNKLIHKYHCPQAEGGSSLLVNNVNATSAYKIMLFIQESRHSLSLWGAAKDLRAEQMPFSIILGRRFLQFADLTFSISRRKFLLTHRPDARGW